MVPLTIACPPFDAGPEPLDRWIQGLRRAGVRHAAPALILALEKLRQSEVSATQRLWLLRLLKAPLLKTCAGLPKPWAMRRGRPGGRCLSLEQRLYRLMFQNLDLALRQMERSHFLPDAREANRLDWVIRNLLRFFQRQLRYAALWGTPMAEGAWRDLHELHAYRSRRGGLVETAASGAGPQTTPEGPELDYMQLLLFGLAADLCASCARGSDLANGLRRWARESRLEEPEAMQGGMDLFLVEISDDSPPRRKPGPLDREFRGWVLVPAAPFMEHLEAVVRGLGQGADPGRAITKA